jgi:hypothetical protein
MKQVLALLCIALSISLNAQLTDDFADTEFTSNPAWGGDITQFSVNSLFQLQSNGDTISASNREIYLSAPSTRIDNTQWEFFVNPKLDPSSNNRIDVYLNSSLEALTGNNTGYFVRIGGTPDEVALFRKDAIGLEVMIIDGTDDALSSASSNPTKVKVTRDQLGNWKLFADYGGSGQLYSLIGTATDITYTSSAWFGILVRYSSTNRQRYYADNFYVGPIIVDTQLPVLTSVKVLNEHELELQFSENVEETTAQNTENYAANNNLGEPVSAVRNPDSFSKIRLTFPVINPFAQGITNTLTVSGIKDLAGNTIAITLRPFLYYRAKPYDVVINEIMADPDPAVLLPNVEYIELANRTNYPINLENWSLKVSSTFRTIPAATLLPDSFLVLTNQTGEELYGGSIALIGMESFPALTNTGTTISLYTENLELASTVQYSDSWYQDNSKSEGGWSLEQISSALPCAGAENWKASTASQGGTPGKRNSVNENITDQTAPEIERVVVVAQDTIRVYFTETIQLFNSISPANYLISDGIGNPAGVYTYPPDYKSVKLALSAPLDSGKIYTVTLTDSLTDCSGNALNTNLVGRFAIPEAVNPGDLVINEILSNPRDGGADFVEILNNSNKIIDLSGLQLGSIDVLTGLLDESKEISPEGYLLFPGEYVVLSENSDGVKNYYYTTNPNGFYQMTDFPTYNNDLGIVVIYRTSDQIIVDVALYANALHFALLNDLDGVTLERINPSRPASDKTNWNSAASTVGYGTPGYRNSQYSPLTESQEGSMAIAPEVFSPDNDGYDDILSIGYEFKGPSYTGSVTIYDSNGRLVKYLVRNKLLGTEGNFSWNGINEENEKARIGIYVVYLEAFDLNGNVVKLKKAAVLGGRL